MLKRYSKMKTTENIEKVEQANCKPKVNETKEERRKKSRKESRMLVNLL